MTQPAILRQKGNAMVMAMKNAVPVKKTPHFSSTWAVTKNLGFMNLLERIIGTKNSLKAPFKKKKE